MVGPNGGRFHKDVGVRLQGEVALWGVEVSAVISCARACVCLLELVVQCVCRGVVSENVWNGLASQGTIKVCLILWNVTVSVFSRKCQHLQEKTKRCRDNNRYFCISIMDT